MERIRALAGREKTTPFTVLLAAYFVFLRRYTGQDDLVLGTATAGRSRPEWESVVGYFLNQVPLRATIDPSAPFSEFLRQVRQTVLQALEHQDFPFSLLVERLQPARDPARPPIFQSMFIWDKPHESGIASSSGRDALDLEPVLMEQCGAPFDLTLILFESGPTHRASLRYNADLFDPATIERMAGHLNMLLRGLVDDEEAAIHDLPFLTLEERRIALNTEAPRAAIDDRPFPFLFEEQCRRTPESTALVCEGQSLGYRALNERANQLARHLRRLGAGPGQIVGIAVPRSLEMVVAVLAVWKSGAAYLPLDPTYPERRLADMIDDARPAVILTRSDVAERFKSPIATLVCIDRSGEDIDTQSVDDLGVPVGPDDLAYTIFTSGSTGRPKGVLLRHRGLSNLVEAQRQVFGLTAEDRALQFASLSFDASVFEIVMPLRAGAALVLTTQSTILPGPDLARLLREESVTTATLPPWVLALLPRDDLPALRTIIVAGEACPADLVSTWAPGRRFFNAYGPTEATVWSSVARCFADGQPPSIGRAILNTRLYVLDARGQPVPAGVPGELHIAGPGIAFGYLNRPELTVEKFIPNPFDGHDEGVLYKTGDLVRMRPDGTLDFLGRLDHQLKLRGYRIETEEVRAVLCEHPSVKDAVVVAQSGGPCAAPSLVAYVVADGSTLAHGDLRAHLRDRLPHFMLPSAIIPIAKIPLTPIGKVDRDALPRLEAARPANGRRTESPRNAVEETLVKIWADVLKVDEVGIHDNFFDLGGASLQTLEVVALAARAGLALTPERLFRYQTVAELALSCEQSKVVACACSEPENNIEPAAQRLISAPREPIRKTSRTVIESLGVYLPPKEVSTAEVVGGCRAKLDFPLERMTGIRSRRMAGETEFAIDLAARAVADCLERSAHEPGAIDLLICCNISRCDGPEFRFSYEPTTAARLQRRFGFANALAFDISNACAGTFTAISIADALLEAGECERALIVSGEYISHLTLTAQKEIADFIDPRIACLTLGDSGVAMVLERSDAEGIGFHDLDLYTLGKYSDLCVAKATEQPHGGAIMLTDPVRSSALTIKQAVSHAVRTIEKRGWPIESIDHVIMHQTSRTTIEGAVREINQVVGRTVCHRGNTIDDLTERGNTATNSHWVALMDNIRAGVIEPGARILFGVSGSGQTVGTALYTFDDLPERLRNPSPKPRTPRQRPPRARLDMPRIRVESIGTVTDDASVSRESLAMLQAAAEHCLRGSRFAREEIGLLIHAGIYRDDFLSEPALAAIAAGLLEINHDAESSPSHRTFAFDLMNGGLGALNACHVASQMIRAGRSSNALILASEIENNASRHPDDLIGLKETGSAFVLEISPGIEGFGAFLFRSFPEFIDDVESHTIARQGKAALRYARSPEADRHAIECIRRTVAEFLDRERVGLADFARIIAPHRSRAFLADLATALGAPLDRFVLLPDDRRDYLTSSLAYSFKKVRDDRMVLPGDLGLVISAGAGVQVGCATYHF
jgi:amino acid adenylation domain-containing protein